MRAALWFLGLFGVAVALALFSGDNPGTITVFWPPYRVDLSLNLVVLLLIVLFVIFHLALRALSALFAMPGHARSWRLQHQERALHMALLDALSHFLAGRFIRARKSAESVIVREATMARSGETLAYAGRLQTLSHLLAAESAHTLQDQAARAQHFDQAMVASDRPDAQGVREALQLRAARWALEDHDASDALQWLDQMPQGAARRTVALRLRLKAARMARQTGSALETARLLSKHRAFSKLASERILRGLALELLTSAHDTDQLMAAWHQLDKAERLMPEVAVQAAQRLMTLGGDAAVARSWLLPIWEQMLTDLTLLAPGQRVSLIQTLEMSFSVAAGAPEPDWLNRIEQAQKQYPADAPLQYLAGIACMRLQLWGKAQQLLNQALPRLRHAALERKTWQALAELAEQRNAPDAAAQAWKRAALLPGA